jgi:hypothetical protein
VARPPAPAAQAQPSVEQRLAKLAELKSKGLITDDEFNARKSKILEEI